MSCLTRGSDPNPDATVSAAFGDSPAPCGRSQRSTLHRVTLTDGPILRAPGLVQSSYFSMDTAKMPAGMGSGFIWDDKGHVVTNYHVIKDANEVQVTLVDQSVWPAKVRGINPRQCIVEESSC